MRLDDVLRRAAGHRPSALEQARFRRVARQVLLDHRQDAATPDADLLDPLAAPHDEVARITHAARIAGLGLIAWDRPAGRLTWSAGMIQLLGRTPSAPRHASTGAPDDVVTPAVLMSCIHPDDLVAVTAAVEDAWAQTRPAEVTFRARLADGTTRYLHALIEVPANGIVATCEDVTGPELARRERARLATREAMLRTGPAAGLPTREYLIDEVDRARRAGDGMVFVVAAEPGTAGLGDDDRDALAAEIGRLLTGANPPHATHGLAAPGLFGVLLRGTTTPAEAERVAVAAVDRVRNHLFSGVRVNAWAGAACFAQGTDADGFALLADAEHAAAEARRTGHVAQIAATPASRAARLRRCRTAVRGAVAGDRFTLAAQPILDLDLNRVTRHEILLRLRGDTGDPIAPWAFLDTAERVGEILPVDRWVIDHAIKLIGRGALDEHCQINVSGRSLADPGLLDHVTRALTRHRVEAGRLTFEITETAAIENRNEALAFATGIRALGAQLALDDFGTGHASLLHLRTLPIDLVKIDGRFVTGLTRTPADRALVERLTLICHDLGIRVVAEKVPDAETIALLRRYGVDFAQGFHIGRPVPMTDPAGRIELDLRPISKLG
ncbi:EAL domain-containing protein (putative c-di-GMP-specific phosphodiesterase class I)/GGDEF domain-containing protein [Catenuloplanes nepalensis]|uniref:EAL domain-containing protein (Putative c-di-GMP-specific phosphodiesterase class I)/GGDEF domain-containing protein n=1 Tax=Catenuloplanes nepalensis TaxID=587533 RepID=A0ABT9MMX7_9ACTN|nr:EAL domain-containing protein [Catenuloplanes nepalensis]MDP9792791.1 EAL domain-containing protein (putative c-di-GMP-specific phosphodiesterase class I)/GGDEF domain-containing protein [Catenuloplanes nepalensis]